MDKLLEIRQIFRICKYLFGISLFGFYAALFYSKPLRVYAEAGSTRLEDWRFYPEALQLEIFLSAPSQPRYFYLAQPPRIVIDLPGTKLGYVPTQENYPGAIQRIRVSQFNAEVTRIVMDLAPGIFLDPKQVQLQPLSWENPTRWILRPLIASDGTSLPQDDLSSPSRNYPPTTITPPSPENPPLSIENPPTPPNLPSGIYPPQPPDNLAPSIENPRAPRNLPSGIYPPQPPDNLAPSVENPAPRNLPSGIYPPQPPDNLPSNIYSAPPSSTFNESPPFTTLPSDTNNYSPQHPFVRVPPLTPNKRSVPPAIFPDEPGNNNNNAPSEGAPNFPVPTLPNSPPNSEVNEFRQPFFFPAP